MCPKRPSLCLQTMYGTTEYSFYEKTSHCTKRCMILTAIAVRCVTAKNYQNRCITESVIDPPWRHASVCIKQCLVHDMWTWNWLRASFIDCQWVETEHAMSYQLRSSLSDFSRRLVVVSSKFFNTVWTWRHASTACCRHCTSYHNTSQHNTSQITMKLLHSSGSSSDRNSDSDGGSQMLQLDIPATVAYSDLPNFCHSWKSAGKIVAQNLSAATKILLTIDKVCHDRRIGLSNLTTFHTNSAMWLFYTCVTSIVM